MLLIDGIYINSGGGKVLFDYLVRELEKTNYAKFYIFDDRINGKYNWIPNNRKIFLPATIYKRYQFYKKNKNKFSKVLCFGNVPPPVRLDMSTFIYFQNISLLIQPENYGLKEKWLKRLKMKYIKNISHKSYNYIVQSKFVQSELSKKIKSAKIEVLPFFEISDIESVISSFDKVKDNFAFISNGNTHKNHHTLLDAWEILAKENIFPKLELTVTSEFSSIISRIDDMKSKGIHIENHGFCDPIPLYQKAKFLIYPSFVESFGLGLIEAINFNCEVIAADLPYVYEICDPYLTFDPNDATNIAHNVKIALEKNDDQFVTKPKIKNEIQSIIRMLRP